MTWCSDCIRRVRRRALPVFLAAVLLSSAGCANVKEFYFGDLWGKRGKTVDKTAEQLAAHGMQSMGKKNFDEAAEDFKKLKENYPYSKFAVLAEMKLGDAYFFDKKYADAGVAYEEFVRMHPRNEVIPYILYQIGMTHFLSFSNPDRDPEETQSAIQSFQRVKQMFPDSDYAKKADKQIFECRKRAASHEFNVARFYYKTGEYAAAKTRLDNMIMKYPQAINDLGYGKVVQKMQAKCEAEIAKGAKNPGVWTKLGL